MKHAILGAGAIGGLVGTGLGSLGEDVTGIVRAGKLTDYSETLSLERPSGTLTTPAKAVARLTKPVDVLWIATKTYQLRAALEAVEAATNTVVPLLNGVDHVAVLRSRYGHDHVVPATISVEAERLAPGRFVQRSPFVRFNLAASAEPLLGSIVARLTDLGFTCQFIPNQQTLLWRDRKSTRLNSSHANISPLPLHHSLPISPRRQRGAIVGIDRCASNRSWLHVPVHPEPADAAVEQAMLSGAVCAGDFSVGKEQGRDLR